MAVTYILAIDPGSSESGWVLLDRATGSPVASGKDPNAWLLNCLAVRILGSPDDRPVSYPAETPVVIEWTSPRGMLASLQLFETMWWAGQFAAVAGQADPQRVHRLERGAVKRHLCGTTAAKDAMVTAALVDRYGGIGGRAAAVGVKAAPGPLYGVKADAWAALAVACTYLDDPELVFGYETENEKRLVKSAARRTARKAAAA